MTTGFTNKLPTLLGSDTHTAILTGSLNIVIGDDDKEIGSTASNPLTSSSGTISTGRIITGTLSSLTVNVANNNSIVIFSVCGGNTTRSNSTYTIEELSVQKASGTITMNPEVNILPSSGHDIQIILGVSAGNHTYEILWSTAQLQTGQWSVDVVNINDTHSGVLNGSNTQRVVDESLIN